MDEHLHPDSYLPEFFTPERLAQYRTLGRRFPLWGGRWPEEITEYPEYWLWTPDARLESLLNEWEYGKGSRGRWVFFGEDDSGRDATPSENLILKPSLECGIGSGLSVYDFQPLIHGALLAAVDYAFFDWTSGTRETVYEKAAEEWTKKFEQFMSSSHRQYVSNAAAFLTQKNRVMLSRKKKRDAEYAKLLKGWTAVGRAVGLIPESRRGGPAVTLPDDFVHTLWEEAQDLVSEVGRWMPDPAESEEIWTLLRGDASSLDEYDRELLIRFEAQQGPVAAERKRSETVEKRRREAGVEGWAQRMKYPILDQRELSLLQHRREDPRTAKNPRTTARLLLEMRLQVRKGYLNDHLPKD